jgi:alkylation response protein AidB-like acyl-CoA dehydrogenase
MPLDPSFPISALPIGSAWGAGPTPGYEALAARFRPLFARIRAGSVARELERRLPFEEVAWLKEAGFTTLRVPHEHGGAGATLPELFVLLIELAQADSNIVQILRGHFAFVEHIRTETNAERRAAWLRRLGAGEIVGTAWSETGPAARLAAFSTRVVQTAEGWRLNGTKFYTTGSLFSDWIHVGASDADDQGVFITIPRHATGVEIVDDWDGMGQRLTASGTGYFTDVAVEAGEITREGMPFPYAEAFFQLVHLATLAGIGRAAADQVAAAVASRKRTYSHAAGPRPAEDPQVLQVVGHVRSAAYSAGAIVLQAARALQRAADAVDQDALEQTAIAETDLETWQAQTVVSDLIVNATATVFDALGASATLRSEGLDRYWRNARTLTSHNPRIYKDRIVGDFAVNGTLPPGQWRIGQP